MKKLLIWFAAVLVCAGLIVGIVLLIHWAEEPEKPQVNLAPDFTVMDGEGNPVKLSDMRGKPVVLNFWASWCPPCKAEMPDFETMYQKYADRVNFMMVDMTDGQSETVEKAKQHIAENGYTFPVYFDTRLDAARVYGISSIPQSYFINADGTLVTFAKGMINGEKLEACIQMILDD